MMRRSNRKPLITGSACLLGTFLLACVPASGTALDDQIKAFKEAGKQTEPAVIAILEAGLNEGRSAQSLAAVKAWLTTQATNNAVLIHKAALTAERGGDFSMASNLYRKLLMLPELDAKLAPESLASMIRLLVNQLGDPDAAYLFLKQEGKRLRQSANTRRYDRWFLDRAAERRDLAGMANGLAAIHNSQDPLELYSADLPRLLGEIETYQHTSEDVINGLRALAASPRTAPDVKARLIWAAEIAPLSVRMAATLQDKRKINEATLNNALKAAEALVAALPFEGSQLVANGWMNFNIGHTPDFTNAVAVARAAKAAPILQALRTLPADQARQVLAHSSPKFGGGRPIAPHLFSMPEMRLLAVQAPQVLNSLDAPDVPLLDASLTAADAKILAPLLARNPHIDAAVIRAFASDLRQYEPVIDAMMKTEMWRTADIKSVCQRVWNVGLFERGKGKDDVPVKKYANLDARYQNLKKQTDKKASTADRMAAFKSLTTDLSAPVPTIPGALSLWGDLFADSPAPDSVAMLKEIKSEELLRLALNRATFGKAGRVPWKPYAPDNHTQYHQAETRKLGADLITHAAQQLRTQMAAGALSETTFGIWLHAADPKSEEAKKLIAELVTSPAWKKLGPLYRASAADPNRFGALALPSVANPWTPAAVSRELLALPADAAPAAVETALKAVTSRASQAPVPVEVIGLQKVASLPAWSDETRRLVFQLFGDLAPIGSYSGSQGYDALIGRIAKDLGEKSNGSQLEPLIGGLWHAARADDFYRNADLLSVLAEKSLAAGQASIAMSLSRAGSAGLAAKALASRKDIPTVVATIARLKTVAGKAAGDIGAVEIAVDETDPAFAIHKSNAEFALGNVESAWQLYLENAAQLPPVMRTLPVDYSMWLLDRNIQADRDQNAESLVKELTIWAREAPGTLSVEQDARLKISYADLAFRKGALPTSRAWYRKVAEAAEYDGTEMQLIAALGSVRVDRVSKNFGAAMTELDKLMKLPNPEFRKKVRYARAEVLMDQESYAEALEETEQVLRQEPKHPDAMILRGKIQNLMRKLVEASEIPLGPSQDKTVIVPGEALKINLRDPTLNISGVGADIEVEIKAKSGDSERVLLYQLGDSKENFRAEIATALGPPTPGDKVLQILGDDEIRYGYSDRFRAKMKDLPADKDVVIRVASDARLTASAGAFPPREGERRLNIEELGLSTAQAALGTRAVRPGNPIYLRVTDPDRSLTPNIDEVSVSLQTTSGDEIRKLVLKETSPFSGEFEGSIPTSGAQAMAYASDNAPGRDPNMAISSKDYPGWQGNVGDAEVTHVFGVNLNDNASPGKLTIDSGGADQELTRFILQTSMNGKDWVTRARVPNDNEVWDGRPHVSSFPTWGNKILPISTPKKRELPNDWQESMEITSARSSVSFLSKHVKSLSADKLPLADVSHPGYSVLFRYRALFHQPTAAIRRFQLTGWAPMTFGGQGVAGAMLLIDGVPAALDAENPLLIERELSPGLHEIQIWGHMSRGQVNDAKPVLLCDVPGKQDLQPCPDSMFSPSSFPETTLSAIPQPATVRPATDGKSEVTFGDRTQARLIRVAILGHKGIAPAIRKVTLDSRDGKVLVPVQQDFMSLRTNEQLEVLPGDQIAVRYEDPRPVTPKRNRHEDRLKVAFNNAVISASFLKYETNKDGERELVLEAIRRFRYDDAIAIVVQDADMDASAEKDIVEVKVTSSAGGTATIKAVETEEHSGRFIGRVFPVPGNPERDSEIKVAEGGDLTATYHDAENLDPGISTTRSVELRHAGYKEPVLDSYQITATPLPPQKPDPTAPPAPSSKAPTTEIVTPQFSLDYLHAAGANPPHAAVAGASLSFDVVAPHLALAGSSVIQAYVQTETGRAKANAKSSSFDPAVPGTLKLTGQLGRPKLVASPGYAPGRPPLPPTNTTPLEEGRFSFAIPLVLGEVPDRSYATTAAEALTADAIPEGLAVKTGDIVHVGYAFEGPDKQIQWKNSSFKVGSNSMLDVMQANYSGPLVRAFVGEKVYLRVIDAAGDQSPNRDAIKVSLKSAGGATTDYELQETEAHSGLFKSVFTISFADASTPAKLPPVALNGFPVRYGDEVEVSYANQSFKVAINMGADGGIEPFSKRFTGDEMAVTTGFTLAECFFELAKKHREMEQESLSRREIAQARKLLAEAVAAHRSDALKAQAEYLLGNLAQEFADLSKNEESKLPMYQDALARFTKVTTDYPDSEFAPKSQFKTALVYEKMKETENAVEEYVKLAYKFPEHELIPSVMSRLGGYYQAKGTDFKQQADELRKKEDDASKAEVLRLDGLSYPPFLNAAMVFSKLRERFPQDPLAGLAGLRAGQNYIRAQQYEKAVKILKPVFENEEYDDKEIRSQALYWSGISMERLLATYSLDNYKGRGAALEEAYQTYRRVTFDFPDSIWAKYSRGRLADPVFEKLASLEKEERDRMIEALKLEKKNRR